jgi:RHS repeat-associated protein
MKNFQDVLLPLQKPFEINAELTATNLLTSGNPLTSGSIADTPNSIAAPVSQTSTINFFTSQKVEDGKSFEQFLTQPQLLGAAPNASPSNLAGGNILIGDKNNILTSSKSNTLTSSKSDILTGGEKLETQASSINFSQLSNTSAPERQAKNSTLPVGVFQVGTSGQVSLDYLFDGGYYQGELAIFSLTGMEALVPGTDAFIFEASRRALTDSTLGHIVLRDSTEGAKFSGSMPGEYNWGSGPYTGAKTFTMTPGDTFGVMLVPNGTVQISYNNQWLWDLFPEHRPMFSVVPANSANSNYQMPIADVTGTGNTIAIEDVPTAQADGDYNDLIFTFIGASGNATPIGTAINPAREWRTTPLGQQIISYANSLVPNDTTGPVIAATLTNDTGTSNSDRITSNPAISGTVTDSSSIASFRAGFDDTPTAEFTNITSFLGSNGSFTLSRAQLETIRRNPLRDGNYTLRLIASDSAGNTSNTFNLNFTLDTAAPQTTLQTPIPGGNHSNTVRVIGTATDTATNLSNLQYSVDGGSPNTLIPGIGGKFDSLPPNSPLATGSHTTTIAATDTAGNQTSQTANFTVANNFTVTPNGSTGWAAASTDTVLLAERNSKLVQALLPVQLGQATGSRTLRFQLKANFDKTDTASAIEDLFQVYLVSPSNSSQTLLDGGTPGTPLFSLAGGKAEFLPGRVRYTGDIVEIDLSSLKNSSSGNLLFRLTDSDTDTGTTVEVKNLTNTVDEEGTASPVFVAAQNKATSGGSLNTSNLTAAPDLKVNFTQVQFDPATGSYKASVQVQNTGSPVSRSVAVVFPNLPAGVTLQNPDGTDSNGKPYINLRSAIPAGGLDAGASSDPVELVISNPNFLKFSLTATALAGEANQAPNLAAVQTINVKVGETFKLPLTGTDSDGDPISFAVKSSASLPTGKITGNGTLEISPTPEEIGTYNLTLVASDGELETTRPVTVNVTASTPGRTRISGVIKNTNQEPLAGVLVGLGDAREITAADGSFEILRLEFPSLAEFGLPDIVPPNTLQIYGDGITGEDNYPYIAEKLPLLLGHEAYPNVNNVISRPIYLPPIDVANGKIINPTADTTVTTAAIPKASVFVKAGSIKDTEGNPYTENLSITQVPTELTPAALPPNLHTDLVVTIQPGDMVFTTPAPLSLPNRAGYAAGTTMDLWSINPTTGFFDNVGTGKVTADGSTIETISGGIRNSSWHFFAPPAPAPKNPGQDPRNPKDKCNECKAKGGLTSEVEMHSGAVIETHNLVPYQSMGESRSLTLTYDSLRADPRPIVHFGYNGAPADAAQKLVTKLTVDAGKFKYQIPGYSGNQYGLTGGEHFWSMPASAGTIDAALQVDMSALPSGQYDYTINSGIRRFTGTIFAGSSTDTKDKLISVNTINSPFGSGWGIAGWQELVENSDSSVLLIDGDGSELVFDKSTSAGGGYVSPPGDFSKFEKLADGTFRRTLKDQTIYSFNTGKRLVSVKEANGNETKYIYDPAGQLSQIIDVAGLITKFTYANGKISQIEDPAGRLTKLEYDAAGNLQKIVDPDTKARTFSYDTQRHITKEIDKRGFSEQTLYDFAGRATGGIRKDGSQLQVAPVQVQGLYREQDTINPLNAPVAKPLGAVEASYADGSGGVITQVLDQTGQVVSTKDGGGLKPSFERNQNLLVTKRTDGRGNVTSYEYDAKGNVKSISDSLAGTAPTISNNNNVNIDLLLNGNNYAVGSYPISVAVGDVTGDGIPDIVTANYSSGNISVVRGKEDKTYEPKIDIALGGTNRQPRDVALADTDGDGDLDIVVADSTSTFSGGVSSSNLLILSNNGGNFTVNTNNPTVGASPYAMATGDMNGDGRLDIVTLNSDNNRKVSVLLADSSSSSGFSTTNYQLSNTVQKLVLADVNRDGRLDVVAANQLNNQSNISVLLGSGNGSLGNPITSAINTSGLTLTSLAVADLNGDGNPEAIFTLTDYSTQSLDNQRLTILSGSGNGSFNSPTNNSFNAELGSFSPTSVVAGDLDFDNDVDLVISGQGYGDNATPDRALVWLNNGSGSFTQVDNADLGYPAKRYYNYPGPAVLADLDGDGDLDLVVANQSSFSNNVAPRFNNSELTGGGPGKRSYTYDPVFNQVTSETDELGRQTLYEIDPLTGNRRKVTKVVGAVGGSDDVVTSYTYTNKNLIDTETDPNGRVTDYDYNPQNQLVKITFAKGTVDEAVQQFEYDVAGNQKAVIDENGIRTEYEYDAMNMLKKTTFAKGTPEEATQQFEYDGDGNQTAVIDENGNRSESEYNIMNQLVKVTAPDPDGSGPLTSPVTSYGYDKSGNQVWMLDPLGRRTEYRYDSRNRLMETVNPDGTVEKMRYDSDNNQTANVDAKGNRTNKVYDARGRLIREVDATGKITRFEYDAANQMVAQIDANNNRTEYKYDSLGMRTDVTQGANTTIASTSKTEYDKVGNVTAEIDANTNKTQYVYDARNRQTRVIDALTPSGITTTEYDDVGNVTSIKDPVNNTTQFVYDARNRLKSETNQFSKTRAFEYDKVGNRTRITDRNNHVRSFTYDALNRETAETWLNATNNPIRTFNSTYDAASQLTSVKDPDSTYQFGYDPKGRQIAVDNTGTPGVPNVLLNYTYDDQDNLLSVKDTINGAAKGNTAYTYDTLNRISQITQSGNGVASKRVDFGYDNIGQIKSVNRYSDLSGSQLVRGTTYTYDAKNRLDVLSHGSGVSYNFNYDNGNRITKITDVDGVTNYTYDKNNQLTVANHSNSNKPNESFSYDANGNRTNSGYQTGTNNRLNSDGKYNYAYDDEGNLTRRTEIASNKVTEYEWDYRNRLAGVFDKNAAGNVTQNVGFKYDSQNRRISKKVGSNETRFVYDRDNVLFDFTAPGANQPVLDQRYFYGTGVDQVLAQESANASVLWALTDQLGTVKDWVNSSGSVADHVVYDAFGRIVSQSNSTQGSRYGFTGREFDAEIGLYYYRSRYYNPSVGRFIGEDSVGFGAGDGNLYRYVGNSPTDRRDPSGMVSLSYQETRPLLAGLCGNYNWIIQWQLNGSDAASANGYVVQKVDLRIVDNSCPVSGCAEPALPPRKKQDIYWEAWPVKNGKVYNVPNSQTPGQDTFYSPPSFGSFGAKDIKAHAKFIPNYEEPNGWGKTEFARDLKSTTVKPSNWSDNGSLYRQITSTFNCCSNLANPTNIVRHIK